MGKGNDIESEVFNYMEGIYINELIWLLTTIRKNCEALFEKTKIPEKGFTIQINMEAHSLIKSIVSDASHVANLIDPGKKRKEETPGHYFFRKERGERLRKIFNSVKIEQILNRELRNSIEHLDERLDDLVHRISKKVIKRQQNLAYNMVFSHKEVIVPTPVLIRVYVSSERMFYNMNWRFDIEKIYSECASMLTAIQSLESIKKSKEPGGLLLLVPKFN
jgi:hypothetical protein